MKRENTRARIGQLEVAGELDSEQELKVTLRDEDETWLTLNEVRLLAIHLLGIEGVQQ